MRVGDPRVMLIVGEGRGPEMTEAERLEALTPAAPDSPVLQEIVRRLVGVYHPERIYLFGSVARGEGGPDSDYDLMVLVADNTPRELRRSVRAYDAFRGLDASTDVLVWTRSAFEEQLPLKACLPAEVVREGRLLYAS